MRYALWFRSIALCIVLSLAIPMQVLSQGKGGEPSRADVQEKRFSQEELAQLLAPIALYPDELISQVLIASTYPLEIVAADRWLEQNKGLDKEELARRLEEQKWDASVKSLVNFPSVLSMMSQKLEITAKLGDAFLAQEGEVMDTIQMLRKRAVDSGNLKSSKEQKVVVEEEVVYIEPAEREVIYVPVYDPLVVYGPWLYPAFPPFPYFFLAPAPFVYFSFAPPFYIGFSWWYAWGGCNWRHRTVYVDIDRHYYVRNRYIDRTRYVRHYERQGVIDRDGRGRWRHDPVHRRGVAYRDPRTAERFGQSPARIMKGRDARGFGDARPGRVEPPAVSPRGEPRGRGAAPADLHKGGGHRREGAFSGGFRDGAGARSASERGRSSRGFSINQGKRSEGVKRLETGGSRGGGGRR